MSDLTKKLEGKEQEEYIREHFKSKEEKSEQIEEEIEEEEEETEEEEDLRELKEKLEELIDGNDIKAEVANDALNAMDSYEDVKDWFSDLLTHGCQSGMIGGLVYYCDTYKFYDTHYNEIEELRDEFENDFGEPLKVDGDLKNWFAWFAYEETARKLAYELGFEI